MSASPFALYADGLLPDAAAAANDVERPLQSSQRSSTPSASPKQTGTELPAVNNKKRAHDDDTDKEDDGARASKAARPAASLGDVSDAVKRGAGSSEAAVVTPDDADEVEELDDEEDAQGSDDGADENALNKGAVLEKENAGVDLVWICGIPFIAERFETYPISKKHNDVESVYITDEPKGVISRGTIVASVPKDVESHNGCRKWYAIVVRIRSRTYRAKARAVKFEIVWLGDKCWFLAQSFMKSVDQTNIDEWRAWLEQFPDNTIWVSNLMRECTGALIWEIVTDGIPNAKLSDKHLVCAESVSRGKRTRKSVWKQVRLDESKDVKPEWTRV